MSAGRLYIDLLAFTPSDKPEGRLEERMMAFLESDSGSESLDAPEFDAINGSGTKADYLLDHRAIVAELKTVNAGPQTQMESRLKARFDQPGAPIAFGTLSVSAVIGSLHDSEAVSKMLVDLAGRAVRRHMRKADDQIASIKERLDLPDAAGLLILMNDSETLIDVSAIAYAIKSAFENPEGSFSHITNIWVAVESHKIAMPGGRKGFPILHVFKSFDNQPALDFMARTLEHWAHRHGGRIERLRHGGDWSVMQPIYEGEGPVLAPFR